MKIKAKINSDKIGHILHHLDVNSPHSLIAAYTEIKDTQKQLLNAESYIKPMLRDFLKSNKWERYLDHNTKSTIFIIPSRKEGVSDDVGILTLRTKQNRLQV